jgi:hypothetical protein
MKERMHFRSPKSEKKSVSDCKFLQQVSIFAMVAGTSIDIKAVSQPFPHRE